MHSLEKKCAYLKLGSICKYYLKKTHGDLVLASELNTKWVHFSVFKLLVNL